MWFIKRKRNKRTVNSVLESIKRHDGTVVNNEFSIKSADELLIRKPDENLSLIQ